MRAACVLRIRMWYPGGMSGFLRGAADEWVVGIVDERRDTEKVVEHGLRCAVGAFHPRLVIGVGLSYDEDRRIHPIDELRGLPDFLLHVADVRPRRRENRDVAEVLVLLGPRR